MRENEAKRQAGEILADKTAREMEALKQEKADLGNLVTKLEIENKKLIKDLQKAEKERDNVLSRKEMVAGENMQLIMEAEAFHEAKADLNNQLRSSQTRVRELEKENHQMRFEFDSKMVGQQAEKYASLVEKNRSLSEWREQLIEKNRALTEENKKYKPLNWIPDYDSFHEFFFSLQVARALCQSRKPAKRRGD